jgi:hypothetical protein
MLGRTRALAVLMKMNKLYFFGHIARRPRVLGAAATAVVAGDDAFLFGFSFRFFWTGWGGRVRNAIGTCQLHHHDVPLHGFASVLASHPKNHRFFLFFPVMKWTTLAFPTTQRKQVSPVRSFSFFGLRVVPDCVSPLTMIETLVLFWFFLKVDHRD